MTNVLIADDHELLRDVLRSYLEAEGGFTIALAGDVDGAVDAIRRQASQDAPGSARDFDVILLDWSMPGMDGFAGLMRVRAAAPACQVAIISGSTPPGIAERALEAGAAGFLPKTLPARTLVNAIRFMAAGERYLPIEWLRASASGGTTGPFDDRLSPRERDVLGALCLGKANKEIARDLGLREPTIKLHVKLLCRKLGARNRTHAAMLAKEAGFC